MSQLTYWKTEFCYLQLWFPVYCNELDHFWELSAYLIGNLRLHCSEPIQSQFSVKSPLLTKWARELNTGWKSLIARAKSCQLRHVDAERLLQIYILPNRPSPNWSLLQCTWLYVKLCNLVEFWVQSYVYSVCTSHLSVFQKSPKTQKTLEKHSISILETIIQFRTLIFSPVCLTERAVQILASYNG